MREDVVFMTSLVNIALKDGEARGIDKPVCLLGP